MMIMRNTPMPRPLTTRILQGVALLAAVAPMATFGASGPKKLPICNGKHLRDANLYGSVLPGSPVPAVVAPPAPPPVPQVKPPADGSPPPPVPAAAPAPDKVSSRADTPTYRSC